MMRWLITLTQVPPDEYGDGYSRRYELMTVYRKRSDDALGRARSIGTPSARDLATVFGSVEPVGYAERTTPERVTDEMVSGLLGQLPPQSSDVLHDEQLQEFMRFAYGGER